MVAMSAADEPREDPDPFRLEDEGKEARPARLPADAPPSAAPSPAAPSEAPPSAVPLAAFERNGVGGDAEDVSTLTVRERQDPAARSRPGPVEKPAGWPLEALSFPLRGKGLPRLLIGTAAFVVVDLLRGAGPFWAFCGWMGFLALVAYLLRVETRIVATTATGRDEMPSLSVEEGWDEALVPYLKFLALVAVLLFPLLLVFLLPMVFPALGRTPSLDALLVLGVALALYLPIVLLARALDDASLRYPLRAIPWMLRGAPACILVAAGWAGIGFVGWVEGKAAVESVVLAVLLAAALRFASLWLVAVGARALGVVGRRVPV